MNADEVMEVLRRTEAVSEGHFRLTSGKHSDFYIQCAMLMQNPEEASVLCRELARQFVGQQVDVVVGPSTGAIIMAYEIAKELGARALFTERDDKVMALRRGFTIKPGERVLAVEDVVTTGGSVLEVVDLATKLGGDVVGIASFVDRSGGNVKFEKPFKALATINSNVFNPEDCPLCRQGTPAIKPGSR